MLTLTIMLGWIDYLLVRRGVRHAELKRTKLRPVVYGFCAACLVTGAVLAGMVVFNLVS